MKDSVFGGKRIELAFDREGSVKKGNEGGILSDEQWDAHVDEVGKCANAVLDVLENYPLPVAMDATELILKSGAGIMGQKAQDLLIQHLEEFHAELTILTLFDVLNKRAEEKQNEEPESTTL